MITLLITIALVGVIVWIITLIPMPEVFKKIIIVIAVICVVIYALQAFGIWTGRSADIPVPQIRN